MKDFMQRAVSGGAGVAVGILIYPFFWGTSHELEWGHAVVIGACSGIVSALVSHKRENSKNL